MTRADVYARALRASQNVKRAGVWAAALRGVFGPVLPARMVHEISRTKELAERRRAHSVDHAGLEVEEHRAWCVLAARGLVVNTLMRSSCASLPPQYSQSQPMP